MAEPAVLPRSLAAVEIVLDPVELLVRRHTQFVYQVAYSILRNHHDAEDAAQEVFLRVLRHKRELEKVRQPRAWLARIAWRVALSRRRKPREVSLETLAQPVSNLRAQGANVEELAATNEMQALLQRLIATLPRGLRETLTLSLAADITSAEVAQVLRIPEASVRTHLLRARQLLREKLSALLEGKHGK